MYSIQIDTTQDISVIDICSIVIRYVLQNNLQSSEPIVCERAISFLSPKKPLVKLFVIWYQVIY